MAKLEGKTALVTGGTPKKLLVTGATGATGGYAVERLLERGHAVRALAHREDDRSKRLQELGAEVVIGACCTYLL